MVTNKAEIRDVTGDPLEPNAALIRASFQTVADELGITQAEDPRFMAFIKAEDLRFIRDAGAVFYGLFNDGNQAGFVAAHYDEDDKWWLKRLAVLPEYRSRGFAGRLVNRVFDHVREHGGEIIHIGIVNEQTELKNWYIRLGFREYEVFKIPTHIFTVCLLDKRLV